MSKIYIPTEEEDQKCLIQYLELKGIKFSAIPNSTWTPSWAQKNKNKAMGVRAGLPDMVIIFPKTNTLIWLELKRDGRTESARGHLSQEQIDWQTALIKCGQRVFTCYGFDEAKNIVDTFLQLKK